ncbi:hypothetical protein LOK49_Contig11G00001 [Camellia lanceoleosa]|nr:hypothetical protein LOK49_Contig11G00001 [Camellia lanceoleosa]
MKRLAPTPFVDVGDEVVESVDEGRDVLGDFDFFGAAKGPVLFVIVLDFVSGDGAAGEVDGALAFLFGGAEDADEPVEAAGNERGGVEESERP